MTSHATGKYYVELFSTTTDTPDVYSILFGFTPPEANLSDYVLRISEHTNALVFSSNGDCFNGPSSIGGDQYVDLLLPFATGQYARTAIDFDAGKVWFGNETTWGGNPAAGTGAALTFVPGSELYFAAETAAVGLATATVNLGGSAFHLSPPNGFLAWNH